MNDGYFYGSQSEMFSFFRIPVVMVRDPAFKKLSLESKYLYGLLLDRMGLSRKNEWFDPDNRVYIIYQVADIAEDLNVSRKKAISCLKELEQFGLVEKKRRGLKLPNILYLKNFMMFVRGGCGSAEMGTSAEGDMEQTDDPEGEILPEGMPENKEKPRTTEGSVQMDIPGSAETDISGGVGMDTSGSARIDT